LITIRVELALKDNLAELISSLAQSHQHIAARNGIIEATQEQLAIQAVYNQCLNQALHLKETRKETDHTKLFPDEKSGVLTGDAFTAKMEAAAHAREAQLAAKEQRKLT
jgi:hypothetical protein